MKNINEILTLADEIEIIEAIGTKVWDKKQNTDSLSEAETHFVLIDIFEGAMNEAGFLHFFNNEVGDYAREVVEAYKKIGAPKTANIIAKAIGLFGVNNFFDDLEKRKKAIINLDELALSGWEDLEEIFFNDEQEEDVVTLIVEFIRNNKEQF